MMLQWQVDIQYWQTETRGDCLMQVLKAEIRERIFDAGVQVFYKKDFRSAKMQEIAERAGVSVSLLYSYY